MSTPPSILARGRASRSNASGRFSAQAREAYDDGWGDDDKHPRQAATTLTAERARTIISRNDSPDLGFDRTINPYRGCEHGCIYCYARPTHAYLDLSPGLDFETKLFFKPDAARLLEAELSKPGYTPARIQLGANTDPYQPIERELGVTREILEVLARFNHPVGITTKSILVTRDIDLLAPMARKNLVFVALSVTTQDRKLARAMEPRASTPDRRFEAISQLSAAGIPVIIGASPMIPSLTDHELEAILERGAAAGATIAYYSALRLPLEIKDLFREWLAAERPDAAARVISLVQQMHGGRDYNPDYHVRMRGQGPIAQLLRRRFQVACERLSLGRRVEDLSTEHFSKPPAAGDQLTLF